MIPLSSLHIGVLPDDTLLFVRTYRDGTVTAEQYVDGIGQREVELRVEPAAVAS